MWEIGETCDNRGPALPPAPDFGSRLKPNILLLWRPNSRRRRRRRRRRGDPTSPPLETPSCCCGTRSQPPPVSNHVGPGQSRLVLHQSLKSIFLPLWSFCNSTRTFCNHICTFDVGVQGKVPIERWLFTREPKDGSSSLFLFLIIKPKSGLCVSSSLTYTPMLFRLDWCDSGRWVWLLNTNLGKLHCTLLLLPMSIGILEILKGKNCRSLIKVKFSTDQVRPALGSGGCSFVNVLKNLKTALFQTFSTWHSNTFCP